MRITRLDAPRCRGGENPLWDPAEGLLYFIDNSGRKVHCYDPLRARTVSWQMPSTVTTLVLRARGGAVVTLRDGIHFLDFETGLLEAVQLLADPPPVIYNDGKVDRRGRFVIGGSTPTIHTPKADGGLFLLDARHELSQLDGDIHFSNGPCWSPDDKILYFSDSYRHTCYAYDYDIASGAVSGRRVFSNTRELGGLPDGATVDSLRQIWIAIYGAGKIAAFHPDGRLVRIIDMPVKLVSSVAFGGAELDKLYVTTIAHAHDSDGAVPEEGAGFLYVVEGLGVTGLPEAKYAG